MSDNALIQIRDFQKKYDGVHAVKGVSFDIEQGEIFGLIGPDGAGKTTLMRSVCTLLKPSGGSIFVHSFDAAQAIGPIRGILGYMPQRFSLYQDLTVEQNLYFFADLFQVPRDQREQQLKRLYRFSRLAPFKNRRAGALSGGMKQKLALSCALIHTPKILILDEPTYGVDPVSRHEFWEILHTINESGTSIFVSTAYMDEAERCDRVALMHQGKLVSIGSPQQIKSEYSYPLYRLRGKNLFHLRSFFRRIETVYRLQLFGDALHVSFKEDPETGDWSKWQKMTENNLTDWTRKSPSMEDVFLELSGELADE